MVDNNTVMGYRHLVKLFIDAYDNDWDAAQAPKKNRELMCMIRRIKFEGVYKL